MSLWARIEDENVAELSRVNPENVAAPDTNWELVPVELETFVDTNYVVDDNDNILPPTLDYLRNQLKAKLAEIRWTKINNGFVTIDGLNYGTKDVDTNNINKTAMLGNIYEANRAAEAAKTPPNNLPAFSTPWKALNGYAELNLQQLTAVGAACGSFIQGCFRDEITAAAAIDEEDNVEDILEAFYINSGTERPEEMPEEVAVGGEQLPIEEVVIPDQDDLEPISLPIGTPVMVVEPAEVDETVPVLEETPYVEDEAEEPAEVDGEA